MKFFSDRFPSLAKHWAVLRESWRAQAFADKAFRPRSDHEFLPAALEIMEKPPSPGLRRLLQLICALFILALIWAAVGKVDVVAVAMGKTVPAGSVKVVQPVELGTVRAIHVRNGQFVKKGDLLLELDPTLATADEAQSERALLSAELVKARNAALLAYAQGSKPNYVPPADTPAEISQTEQTFVRTAIAEFEAQRASLLQQRAQRNAELAAAKGEIAKLQESLPYLEQQLAARKELAEKGYYSKLQLLEYEQLRAEKLRDLDIQRANSDRALAAVAGLNAELASLREGFGKTAVTGLSEANEKSGQAREELRKSVRRREYQQLRAPIDGVVQQLAVTTIGGVVQPAQPLMVIVPCSRKETGDVQCGGAIEVEAFIQNKDVGFVHAGQRAAVKVEAFNFTDYGMIEGTVETISRDAIDQSSSHDRFGGVASGDAQEALVYAARIRLRCVMRRSARSASLCKRVQPGMAVQAEIKTGQRRIIQYLLSPISQALSEAGRER